MSYENKKNELANKYPAIEDLRIKAKKRIPDVAWAYLETGTTHEHLLCKNRAALKDITFTPRFCRGALVPDIKTTIMGQTYAAPFGIAPVGLTGLMWPRAEVILATTAKKYNIPYCLSTVATETPETVGPHVGNNGWFQLYTPNDKKLRLEILNRAKNSGFKTLVITVDIPTPSRRERTKRAGLTTPPKITPSFIWQGITNPSWTIGTLKNGIPKLRTIEGYAEFSRALSVGAFKEDQQGFNLTWEFIKEIRDEWQGPVVVKGILHPEDAEMAVQIGMDGVVVSNHGARQFDGAAASIDALPGIVNAVKGKTAILFDSGIRSGLDIMRAISYGADFVLLGRSFIYGVAALGKYGGDHAAEILMGDLANNMVQLGIDNLDEIRGMNL